MGAAKKFMNPQPEKKQAKFYYGDEDDIFMLDTTAVEMKRNITSEDIMRLSIMRGKGYCCGCCEYYDFCVCKKSPSLKNIVGYFDYANEDLRVATTTICFDFKPSSRYFADMRLDKNNNIYSRENPKKRYKNIWDAMIDLYIQTDLRCKSIEDEYEKISKYRAEILDKLKKSEKSNKDNKMFVEYLKTIFGKDVVNKIVRDYNKEVAEND